MGWKSLESRDEVEHSRRSKGHKADVYRAAGNLMWLEKEMKQFAEARLDRDCILWEGR